MNALDIIAARRDGRVHTEEEIRFLVHAVTAGTIPDYQVAAWLMAAVLRPLGVDETAWLTRAMADSGERVDLTGLPKPWLDKHSTGGVGDKTTLVLLPLLASCGITMAKMSGRGLGITGGTVDKLESVPGFRINLTPEELKEQAGRIGVAITGQTPRLAPADGKLYALRDVTATVASIPLIVSSILSKKIAGGAETVVLDVKCGSGAFMTELASARQLADCLRETGRLCGLDVWTEITDMSRPLGEAVGNALEVREAIHTLRGGGPARFRELCLLLAGEALMAGGKASERESGYAMAREALDEGKAYRKAEEWFFAQSGIASLEEVDARLPVAPSLRVIVHEGASGWVAEVDASQVGEAVLDLGGGRREKGQAIDPSVGVECLVAVGDRIEPGQPVFRIHASGEPAADHAQGRLASALRVSESRVEARPLIL